MVVEVELWVLCVCEEAGGLCIWAELGGILVVVVVVVEAGGEK